MIARILLTILPSLLLYSSHQITPLALAQSTFTPQSTWGSASVYIEGKAFYVQSGRLNGRKTTTKQTYSISLNTSWNVTAPAYTALPNGLNGYLYANVLLDNVMWGAFRNYAFYYYNLTSLAVVKDGFAAPHKDGQALAAAFDPSEREIVVPGAGDRGNSTYATMRMTLPTVSVTLQYPFADVDTHKYYSIVASDTDKAMFYFGGMVGDQVFDTFARLDYGRSRKWTAIVDAAGEGEGKVVKSDIYIYDVATNTWEQGPDGGPSRARAAHSCAASGDNIIFQGGYTNSNYDKVPELTSVFSLKSNTWQQSFVPSTPPSGDRVPTGPILGAVAGGGATVFAIVTLVFWIRHRARSKTEEEISEKLPTVRHGPQLYSDDSGSWDAKSVQQILDRERRQHYAPVLLRSPHSSHDPTMFPFEKMVGRPEMVPTNLWLDEKKVDRGMSQFVLTIPTPPSPPRNPQQLRSVFEEPVHRARKTGE
ncbi:hypothetical protein BGZ93_001502 [Podila epicladia]|nr:hypothetical protein BGZ93_001502 [Podila epicladia]